MVNLRLFFKSGAGWRKYLIQLIILPLFLMACSSTPDKRDNADLARAKYKEAIKYSSLKMNKEMYANLKEAIELDPEEALYHLELGNAYFLDNRLNEAESEFLLSIKLNDSIQDTFKRLGRLYMVQQKWDTAIHYFKEVMNRPGVTHPHHVQNWIAVSYYAKGEVNLAEKAWRDALNINENSQIRLNLALAYLDNKRYDLAGKSLRKAIDLDPFFSQAHYELAQLYLKEKKLDLALNHFKQVAELEPLSKKGKTSQEYIDLINSEMK